MAPADETGNGQDQQQQYWQQPYEPYEPHEPHERYGQQSHDYSAHDYSAHEYPAHEYPAQDYSAHGDYGQQEGYDPAAYQQYGYDPGVYGRQQYEQPQYEQPRYEQQVYGYDANGQPVYYDPQYVQQYQQYQGYSGDQQYQTYQADQAYQPDPAYYAQPGTAAYGAVAEEPVAETIAVPAQASAPEQESIPEPGGATAVGRDDDLVGGGGLKERLVDAALGRGPGVDRKSYRTKLAVGGGALILLAGAGYLVSSGGSSSDGSSGGGGSAQTQADIGVNHGKAWAAPADAGTGSGSSGSSSSGGANDGLVGAWATTNAVVRGDGSGVTAYAATDGHKLWSVTPPASGAVPCAMSPTVNSSGVGGVLFQAKPGTGQACDLLVAVDSGSGETKWKAQLPSGGGTSYGASVLASDTRVVAVSDSAAVGYDAAGGKQAWSYSGPGKYCALSGNGDGTSLLLQSTCADTNPKQQVISLDPSTGKLRWWRGLPQNASSYTVLSAAPAVVSVHMSDPTKDTLMSFTEKGDTQATIPVAQNGGTLDSTRGSFDPAPALFFSGTTMVAAVDPPTSSATAASGPTVIAAYSLVTGKELWRTTAQEKGVAEPVGIDGSAAVVATEERVGQPARLSHFDLTSGTETVGGTFPQGTGSLLGSGRLLLRGGMVVALPEYTGSYNTAATAWKAAG